ncbi:MAG: penicillin-binding transpeptidase domain-containing protein [Eubacteriales bacterium]|nr:penicillin-binding transpeptidase domain-containing protein [Eubacteriales bacterium]
MKTNRKIIFSLAIMSILFLSLVVYLTYFTLFESDDIAANAYNRRLWSHEEGVLRGEIVDRNGVVLAESEFVDGGQIRKYNYGPLYCHVIGYNSIVYGRTQLELKFNDQLLGKSKLSDIMGIPSMQNKGYTLELTLDHKVQSAASKAMANRKGAVIAMNPQTGEVLAMYSNPGFDPNEQALIKNWDALTESEDSPFISRSINGLYAPGSTFKVVTSAAAIENDFSRMIYEDEGEITYGDMSISNYGKKVYGELDFTRAFTLSANTYFAKLGTLLGKDAMKDKAEDFGFNKRIDFELDVTKSTFPSGKMSDMDAAQLAIGQHQISATPMQMMLVASAVANGGVIQKPYIVKKADFLTGTKKAMEPEVAEQLGLLMESVVREGTGTSAGISGVTVAGKTGTAENETKGDDHAWFIGYAPADNPTIAVAVILEYSGGSGGAVAAPVARTVMKTWLDNN